MRNGQNGINPICNSARKGDFRFVCLANFVSMVNTGQPQTENLGPEEMAQNHCKICPARLELRDNLDMENLDDLVIYFQAILSDKTKTS